MNRFSRYNSLPFYNNYYRRNYYNNYIPPNFKKEDSTINDEAPPKTDNRKLNNINPNDTVWLDLFGIKLYFDDILILSLLFFLYKEEIKDESLFLSLVLLLIS